MVAAPALFVLDANGEAYDVLHFCSEECRDTIRQNTEHTVKPGTSADFIAFTVCDECGVLL